ncbi:hypothetical protein DFA_06360 [Cavenderia fasciculata]|uniref:Uncharacterized protein n=1 Tax=Cavenderia fasciculata TaxID=261658 RepID=F4PKT9_CACFS|nr:uncharacterized protein DFA_06360 [Cavenderia fasciculata]EGG24213.1 hypothetical protein DFA_06360 [Cavenderia fasciculata]|eukprot:XP_004362064.1 hypothetical protein DFA_06360 [Cavenderia fasciculata]
MGLCQTLSTTRDGQETSTAMRICSVAYNNNDGNNNGIVSDV